MERQMSEDDIIGRHWDNVGGPSGPGDFYFVGVPTGETWNEGENERSVHGLNRSGSVFAFQEFLKNEKFQVPASKDDTQTCFSADDEAENNCDGEVSEEKSNLTVETDINAALNPLFSGLHHEMTPTSAEIDPLEQNEYYKAKLDEACFVARRIQEAEQRRLDSAKSGAVQLYRSVDYDFGYRQSSGAIYLTDDEARNVRTASGGLRAPTSKPVTSGSSQDQSDDEDCDNELNLEPGDKKREKRMLSNRESARRSRRRKQLHLSDLETQVAQLRTRNSRLSDNLVTTYQKLKDAAKDNLQMKTYVEMVKAKLMNYRTIQQQMNMAESIAQSYPPSTVGMQEFSGHSGLGWQPADNNLQRNTFFMPPRITTASMAMPPRIVTPWIATQFFNQHRGMDQSVSQAVQQGMKMSRTPSLQRVSSLDHLKKKVRKSGASCSSTSWGAASFDLDGVFT